MVLFIRPERFGIFQFSDTFNVPSACACMYVSHTKGIEQFVSPPRGLPHNQSGYTLTVCVYVLLFQHVYVYRSTVVHGVYTITNVCIKPCPPCAPVDDAFSRRRAGSSYFIGAKFGLSNKCRSPDGGKWRGHGSRLAYIGIGKVKNCTYTDRTIHIKRTLYR